MAGHGPRRAVRVDDSRSSGRATLVKVGVLVVLALLVLGGLFALQALKARSALIEAQHQAELLRAAMVEGNQTSAESALVALKVSTTDAHSNTNGVLWKLGSRVPFVGKNVEAVRTVSRVLHDISTAGLDDVVAAAGDISGATFSPKDGRLDLEAISQIAPGLARADEVLTAGRQDVRDVDPDDLIGPLSGPITNLHSVLDRAQTAARAGATAARLVPPMLGADERRRYLLVFQNNAELRSTGGLPGAFAVLTARDGRIRITRQGSAHDIGIFDKSVVELTEDEKSLYSDLMGSRWADAGFTPDFPRSAEIFQTMYEMAFDQKTDGVISVDPVALSYILEATGPISLSEGPDLTARNAVSLLLNKVYLDLPPDAQDLYFADAARRVFDRVIAGQADPVAVITQLVRAADENRILISSSHSDEQQTLASTRVSGMIPTEATGAPHVGLYLNDSTGAKLQYYLKRSTKVSSVECRHDESQVLSATTTLSSSVPKNGRSLPPSVTGVGSGKNGSMRMNLRYYAPLGGSVTAVTIDGEDQTVVRGAHLGHDVAVVPLELAPGQSMTVTVEVETGPHQPENAVFTTTPGIEPTPNDVHVASACHPNE